MTAARSVRDREESSRTTEGDCTNRTNGADVDCPLQRLSQNARSAPIPAPQRAQSEPIVERRSHVCCPIA